MRTRIALAAAVTAALFIGITNTVPAGAASGAQSRATRPARPAQGRRSAPPELRRATAALAAWNPSELSELTAGVPGFLAPALGAVRRTSARHRVGEDAAPLASSTRAQAMSAHTVQMERTIVAWRAAHPAPATPTPRATPAPVVVTDATSTTTADWACIRVHESGDRYNTPSVPGGAYGFLESTWLSLGYAGWPYQAPAAVQDRAVLFLYSEFGWQPWSTRFVCGL